MNLNRERNRMLPVTFFFLFKESPVRGNSVPEGASAPLAADREALQLPCSQQFGVAEPDSQPLLRPQLGGDAASLGASLPHRRRSRWPGRGHASHHSTVHMWVKIIGSWWPEMKIEICWYNLWYCVILQRQHWCGPRWLAAAACVVPAGAWWAPHSPRWCPRTPTCCPWPALPSPIAPRQTTNISCSARIGGGM